MGKRGPAPTPSKLLELRGSWRAKTRPGEPQPEAATAAPPIPRWVRRKARKYWPEISAELVAMQVLTTADTTALAVLVETLAEYIEAGKDVDQLGRYLTTDKGNVIQHPAVSVMHKSREQLLRLLATFGLTPAARAGVSVVVPIEDDDPAERFFRKVERDMNKRFDD